MLNVRMLGFRGRNHAKDQSYFLYGLPAHRVGHFILPLAELTDAAQDDAEPADQSEYEFLPSAASILDEVPPERAICYCGSGVTACHLILAMEASGFSGAQLYVGSWSEWCRQERAGATR